MRLEQDQHREGNGKGEPDEAGTVGACVWCVTGGARLACDDGERVRVSAFELYLLDIWAMLPSCLLMCHARPLLNLVKIPATTTRGKSTTAQVTIAAQK